MNNLTDDLPENIQRRLDLFKMFYPLEGKYERRWAKIFHLSFAEITEKFKEKSIEENYWQEVLRENLILWRDTVDKDISCMFYFIQDATDFKAVQNLFKPIDQHILLLTYAIVHQRKDVGGKAKIINPPFATGESAGAPFRKGDKIDFLPRMVGPVRFTYLGYIYKLALRLCLRAHHAHKCAIRFP